ncbi:MAG: ATP-binding protein [Treponema sp.]|nr:ATP-binding protein [Treponema sp.]
MGGVWEDFSGTFRVLLVTGQRQVGKTTFLAEMARGKRRYLSLDNIKLRTLAQNDPELFLQQYPPPVLIDEIQYAPELFPYIKIYVDTHRNHKGAFWLTGSQKYSLMKGVQESLAGRILILDLLGLSYREKAKIPYSGKPFMPEAGIQKGGRRRQDPQKALTLNEVYRLIWEGSLPEPVVHKKINREAFYGSYVQSYIERDVRDFYNIEKPIQFYNFLAAAAARTGNLINYNKLADDTGIDLKTAQAWMGILERTGLVYLLRPYSPNVTGRIIKTPKLYFLDTGLGAYLTRWDSPESLSAGAMDGAILETYCLGEILKSYWHNGKTPLVYFYRDTDQKEIDFVIEQNMTLYPVEVKKTAMPGEADARHFRALAKLGKKTGPGAVLCLIQERFPINRETTAIPVWEI